MRITRDRRRFLAGAGAIVLGLPAMRAALAQQASGAPYKIGVTYPLSGPQGAWGQLIVPAIEIAAQHVNEAGGVNGRPLALVVEDSKGNPEGAIPAMRKVVQVDGVQVIMTIFTNVVSAQMPLSQQFKVPLISPVEPSSSAHPSVRATTEISSGPRTITRKMPRHGGAMRLRM